jgi:hypothetical protein
VRLERLDQLVLTVRDIAAPYARPARPLLPHRGAGVAYLAACGVPVVAGPLESVYPRDLGGNPIEIANAPPPDA